MRHAYLILAHNEYQILSKLIGLLDDPRNDIYIHIDKKSDMPDQMFIKAIHSQVNILSKRVDVRWGHVSQIEAELTLLDAATKENEYDFLHVISGVHLPLYNQDYIHEFYKSKQGKELFLPMDSNSLEAENKMHRYNFFMDEFKSNGKDNVFAQRLWRILLEFQKKIGIRRNKRLTFQKASNWVSISSAAAKYLVDNKASILKRYKYTMCADEFFILSELKNSGISWNIEFNERLLLHEIIKANAKTFRNEDANEVIKSTCLFARKFNSDNTEIINLIENKINHIL